MREINSMRNFSSMVVTKGVSPVSMSQCDLLPAQYTNSDVYARTYARTRILRPISRDNHTYPHTPHTHCFPGCSLGSRRSSWPGLPPSLPVPSQPCGHSRREPVTGSSDYTSPPGRNSPVCVCECVCADTSVCGYECVCGNECVSADTCVCVRWECVYFCVGVVQCSLAASICPSPEPTVALPGAAGFRRARAL